MTFSLVLADGSPTSTSVVTGASQDSHRVQRGDLYVALPGRRVHGARFADQAVAAGAVAVLTDSHGLAILPESTRRRVPVLLAEEPRLIVGAISALLHDDPSRHLAILGVTGTNGKTTTTYLAHHLLRSAGVPAGLIGTVAVRTLDAEQPSLLTTPEAPDLQRMLASMHAAGVDTVALEVSSHALALHRIDGTRFEVVAFTNLSRDHLDFHSTMTDYLDAKLRLFTEGFAAEAVVCVDDDAGRSVAERARAAGMSVTTVSAVQPAPVGVDVSVGPVAATADGAQRFQLHGPFGAAGARLTVDVELPMPGSYNASNAAVALAAVYRLLLRRHADGRSSTAPDITGLAAELVDFPGVPGRMQRIVAPGAAGHTPLVFVDYAHTPDALGSLLAALRAVTTGRLVIVLGAGGERDVGKRGAMGAAAATVADVVIVTDDNPRSEDPAAIRAAVLDGATTTRGSRAVEIVEVGDRAAAIARALAACGGAGDTVVISGKGHESGQHYATGTPMPFDDRAVAAAALHTWAVGAGLIGTDALVAR